MQFVLHADDDQASRWDLQYLIKNIDESVHVLGFADGLELIRHLEQMQVEHVHQTIIFLDMDMPLWNGIKALQVLKATPAFNFVPVYIWSELKSPQGNALYLNHGVLSVHAKPVEPHEWDDAKNNLRKILITTR